MTSNDFDDAIMTMDTPDNGTSFVIHNLIPDTTYTVFVSAFTGAGEGNNTVTIADKTPPDRKTLVCVHVATIIIYSHMHLYNESLYVTYCYGLHCIKCVCQLQEQISTI